MTSKHRYFANEYVGLIVKTEDNQVWTKRVAYPGKKLYVRGVSRLDEIQMKNQSLIEFKIWVSPVDPEIDSSQMIWRNRTCTTNDFDHYTRFGDIHEKVMLWYLISNVGSIQVFADPRFVPSEKCRPMTGNYNPHKLYRNFVSPRKEYDWRNDIWEYPKIEVDGDLINRGFLEVQGDSIAEVEREESCETKLSRCLSGSEMRQASRRLVKCEAHLSLREARNVEATSVALDRADTCEKILSSCHEKMIASEKTVEDMSRREALIQDDISEKETMLKERTEKLDDALSRIADCSSKLSESTSRTVELEKKESACQEMESILEDTLSRVSDCTAKLESRRSEFESELETTEAMLNEARSQISDCSATLSALTSEVQTCKKDVKTCGEQIKICNEEIEIWNEKVEACNEKEVVCNEIVRLEHVTSSLSTLTHSYGTQHTFNTAPKQTKGTTQRTNALQLYLDTVRVLRAIICGNRSRGT